MEHIGTNKVKNCLFTQGVYRKLRETPARALAGFETKQK